MSRVNPTTPFRYRDSQLYGWPFFTARKALRASAQWMFQAADALSQREKYPSPLFFKPLIPANRRLQGLHRGRCCFVLGNGPSLKAQDIQTLTGELTFAMNGFLNYPGIGQFQPTYYCLTDPAYFDRSPPSTDFLDRLLRTIPASRLVVPCSAASEMTRRQVNPDRLTFVTYCGKLESAPLRRLDLSRPLPAVQTCAHLAILAALYTGCSPIYLLGMDHDWLSHRGPDRHFYPQKTLANHPAAHGELSRYSYRSLLEDVLSVWRGYENLDAYARSQRQPIINCTRGGFLDVFPRETLESIIQHKSAA